MCSYFPRTAPMRDSHDIVIFCSSTLWRTFPPSSVNLATGLVLEIMPPFALRIFDAVCAANVTMCRTMTRTGGRRLGKEKRMAYCEEPEATRAIS